MQSKYPGLYLYYDWIDALEKIPPDKAMQIIRNLRNYSEKDEEPSPVGGAEDIIQSFMLSQLRRSKRSSESNKKTFQRKREETPLLISDQVPREELDREANDEEIRLLQGTLERNARRAASEKAARVIESVRRTFGDPMNL